ncbi:MAG TPA: right-handed parallel beta-helix repeat-containing protein [Terriglobales bacterium]
MENLLRKSLFCTLIFACTASLSWSRTLCVNHAGSHGCYATINDAIAHASAHDTIEVWPGTYKENVVINKSLSLIGDRWHNPVIDATGLANGIYVDGLDNSGLREVVVKGFTIENANFEGILITNASFVTIFGNAVLNNDRSLNAAASTCPGIPAFETAEDMDCGEGLHLSGVSHSTISNNHVARNSGGILISDDTGANHHNLISGNIVEDNPFDCGITLASHPPAMLTGATAPLGVFHNTISGNQSSRNGLQGEGAGVGIFDSVPGAKNYGNVVVGNKVTDNHLPGVALHSHTPGQNLNNNVIVNNWISGNGADTDDAATSGPTGINVFGVSPIQGTIISQNTVSHEAVDVAVNTSGYVDVHLNNLFGRGTGLANLGSGRVDAIENWWGCPAGPGGHGCSSVSGSKVLVEPWLARPYESFAFQEQHGHGRH